MAIENSIDSRKIYDYLMLPMVIRHRKIDDELVYTGFIPGMTEIDIIEKDFSLCKKQLKSKTRLLVVDYIENNKAFPFFPTKEDLMQDYEDIVSITFIKIPC